MTNCYSYINLCNKLLFFSFFFLIKSYHNKRGSISTKKIKSARWTLRNSFYRPEDFGQIENSSNSNENGEELGKQWRKSNQIGSRIILRRNSIKMLFLQIVVKNIEKAILIRGNPRKGCIVNGDAESGNRFGPVFVR